MRQYAWQLVAGPPTRGNLGLAPPQAEPCFISTRGWESRNNLPSVAAGGGLMLAVYVDTVPAALDEGPEALRAAGFDVRDAVATTPSEVVSATRGATALLVGDSPITAEVFAALPELAIVSTVTVGVDHIDLEAAAAHGAWVANVPDATTKEVATTSLAMALALVRHVPFLDRHARDGGWDCFETGPRRRPSSLTLGIVGMGRTGRFLARLAAPTFGRVAATDPAPAGTWPPGVERLPLDELLRASDVLALHARPSAALPRWWTRRRSACCQVARSWSIAPAARCSTWTHCSRPSTTVGSAAPRSTSCPRSRRRPTRRCCAILAWS